MTNEELGELANKCELQIRTLPDKPAQRYLTIFAALKKAVEPLQAENGRLRMELESAKGTLEISNLFTVHRIISEALEREQQKL